MVFGAFSTVSSKHSSLNTSKDSPASLIVISFSGTKLLIIHSRTFSTLTESIARQYDFPIYSVCLTMCRSIYILFVQVPAAWNGWHWLKLAKWVLRTSRKCEKFTDGQTDNKWRAIRKAHLKFQVRWAKKKGRRWNLVPVPPFLILA